MGQTINQNIIKVVSASRTTAKLMKTGQTTSYRTGDDGDLEAGREVDFFTLAENNPFGNTNRFTDELGGQDYTNDIVIDWSTYDGSTVLGWYNSPAAQGSATWNQAIDMSITTSVSTYTSGWHLPNFIELISICNEGINGSLNYTPFNYYMISGSGSFWSSTTNAKNSGQAKAMNFSQQILANLTKTNSYSFIPVRNFTVNGTTLT